MNGNRVFVDTNILVYFLQGDNDVIEMISDKNIVVSFITELELLSYPDLDKDSIEIIKGLLESCHIVDINDNIKDQTIKFRKNSSLKIPDAIIAASAYTMELPLITADKIFKSIDDLEVIMYEI